MQKLSTAQHTLLACVRDHGVERRCYVTKSPGTTSLRWLWVSCYDESQFRDSTVTALVRTGLVTCIRGGLLPGAPSDPLEIALGNWRTPDRLELVSNK